MPRKDPGKERARLKAYYAANREQILLRATARRESNREKRQAYGKAWRVANREKIRLHAWRRRKLPAATRPEADFCECCGLMTARHLCLDHCHASGEFRGWLCSNCNTGIGKLGDDILGVQRAISYLLRVEKHNHPERTAFWVRALKDLLEGKPFAERVKNP